MKRVGVRVAIVAVLLVCWLLLDASGVLRSERRTPERTTARDNISDPSEPTVPDWSVEDDEAPRIPVPVDLSEVDLDLDLHGVVVDQDDKPIGGAELQTVSYPARRASTLNIERRYDETAGPSTRSASDGTFAIRLARGSVWNLRASAKGRCTTELKQVMAGERIKVVLAPGVTVIVAARDEEGRPVPAVRIRVFSNSSSTVQVTRWQTTNEQGLARFERMPPGLDFWVDPRHSVFGSPGWQQLKTRTDGEQRFELKMLKGRTLTGRVTDAETRAPIPGAKVGISWVMRQHTFTNADGEYSLTGWTGKGSTEIAVDAPEHAQERREVGDETRLDFALAPGGAASGRIVDATGAPVAGARVEAVGSGQDGAMQVLCRRYTRSADDGRFLLKGLRIEFPLSLVVIASGLGRKLVPFQAERAPKHFGDVILVKGLSIEGVVIGGDSKPLPRIGVSLKSMSPGQPRHWYGNTEQRHTDHLGRFRFPDQTPGTFKLTVRPEGAGEITRTVELKPGEDLRGVELRFPKGRTFVVWVHDEDGKPIQGARCTVSHTGDGGEKWVSAQTDATGAATFFVTGMVGRIGSPSLGGPIVYAPAKPITQVPMSAKEVRFVLKKGAVVTGKVLLDGQPVPLARIEVWRGGKRQTTLIGSDKGTFRVVGARDQSVDLILRGCYRRVRNGGLTASGTPMLEGELRNIRPGTRDVVLHARAIPADATITVRVLDSDGNPIAKANVSIGLARGSTDENGTIAFEGLPRSKTTIYVYMGRIPPGQILPAPLAVTPQGQEVVMRLEKGVPVSGTIFGPDGKRGRFVVTVLMANRALWSVACDAEGRFTTYVPEKPTGKITIQSQWRDKDGETYVATTEYAPGAALRLQLAKQ